MHGCWRQIRRHSRRDNEYDGKFRRLCLAHSTRLHCRAHRRLEPHVLCDGGAVFVRCDLLVVSRSDHAPGNAGQGLTKSCKNWNESVDVQSVMGHGFYGYTISISPPTAITRLLGKKNLLPARRTAINRTTW